MPSRLPRRLSRAVPHAALALLALLGAVAPAGCGGSGGGSPDPAAIAGRILLPGEDWGVVAEAEPNGSIAQAQRLPPAQPDSRVVVAGEAGAVSTRYGVVDTTDALRVVCARPQAWTLTLLASTDGAALGSFDLAAFDAATGASLGAAATAANPEVLEFATAADAPFDVVVTCAAGAGAWTLTIEGATPVAALVAETPAGLPSAEAVSYLLDEPECVPGRVLVRAGAGAEEAGRLAASVGARVVGRTGGGSWALAFAPKFSDAGRREAVAVAARLAGRPGVRWAEPDAVVRASGNPPNDPLHGLQWNLRAIGVHAAWSVTRGDPSVVVGVVDSGIVAHPDLAGQTAPGYDFVGDPAIAGDGDGRDADPTDTGTGGEPDGTSDWHGSHVAGIVAAASDDGVGIAGVAPGCRVMPLRALGIGGGTAADLADAILYAAGLLGVDGGAPLASPVRVLNLSLGTPVDAAEIRDAVQRAAAAGVLVVAATGNDGGAVLYPAAYPDVVAVSAVDGRLSFADYSNRGPEVALAAPGGVRTRDTGGDGFADGVLSSVLDETVSPSAAGWGALVGTSMAAPHVAGVAALLFSVDPTLDAAACRALLVGSCRDLEVPGPDERTGAGLLQAGEAVRAALAARGTPRVDPPRLWLSHSAVRVSAAESVREVAVGNAGGGTLHVASVSVSTDSGAPWLFAFTVAGEPGDPCDVAEIAIFVDRAGMASGVYAGSVLVSDGVSTIGSVRVVLEVGAWPLTGRRLVVSARDATTGAFAKSGYADPFDAYRYALVGLAPGRYLVRAGTDLDDDGFSCEAGDACGEHGGTPPTPVEVGSGERVEGVDVVLNAPGS